MRLKIDLIRVDILLVKSQNTKKKQWFLVQSNSLENMSLKVHPYNLPTCLQIKCDLLLSQLITEKVNFLCTFKQIANREINKSSYTRIINSDNAFFLLHIIWNWVLSSETDSLSTCTWNFQQKKRSIFYCCLSVDGDPNKEM